MRRNWMFVIPVVLVGIVRVWSASARADERMEPVAPVAAVTKAVSGVLGPRPHGPVHAVTKAVTRLAETPSGPTHAVTKAITELAPEPKGPLHVVTKAITELRDAAPAPIGSKNPPSDDAPDPEEKP